MEIRLAFALLLATATTGCGNYVALRAPNDEVRIAEFPNPSNAQASESHSMRTVDDQDRTRVGVAQVAGTAGLCSYQVEDGEGKSQLTIHNRKGATKASYRDRDLADRIEALTGTSTYSAAGFTNSGFHPNFFGCVGVGPASSQFDLVVYVQPIISGTDLLPQNVALHVSGRTGEITDAEFYGRTKSPTRIVMQVPDGDGHSIAADPATDRLTIDNQDARYPNSRLIVLHGGYASGSSEPDSDFGYAFR